MKSYYKGALRKREAMDKAGAMLTDEQALEVKDLYRQWDKLIGVTIEAEEGVVHKFLYGNDLYKFIGAYPHTFSAEWVPGVGTESLYTRIDEEHEGTIDDPIPYNGNMALVEGLYYAQDGVTYYCWRSTGIPVYNTLAELVGLYVEVAETESNKSSSGLLTEE